MTTREKHTPGPYCTMPAQHGGMYIRGFDGTDVARLGLDINHDDRKTLENARFIVRACNAHDDLLAALEKTITAAEIIDGQDSPPASEDVDYLHATIREARAAIAKAREGK